MDKNIIMELSEIRNVLNMQDSNNIIQYSQFYDIIESDRMWDIIRMKKNIQLVKSIHKYRIHHTEKSGWFTVVDDDTQPSGKRKIRKSTEEKLLEALVAVYIDNSKKNNTFAEVYHDWIDWKTTSHNAENIKRIKYEWKAYYENEPLSKEIIQKPLSKITSLDLRQWAESLLKKYCPDKKKFARMFMIVNQVYEYASDEDLNIVSENLWHRARKKLNKELIAPTPIPTDESQVFTDEDRMLLKTMIREDLQRYKKQPTCAGLQILFLFETGLRIGECCGLKWSDIKDGRLYIQRQANNERVKEKPKTNSSIRDIPLTKEALKILDEVREYNRTHGFTAEWIFQSSNPKYDYRLSYFASDRKLRKLCDRLNITRKSPHKCRKTAISILLDSPDINNRTVQRFAGHSDITTTYKFYCYERKSKEQQAKAIDNALAVSQ